MPTTTELTVNGASGTVTVDDSAPLISSCATISSSKERAKVAAKGSAVAAPYCSTGAPFRRATLAGPTAAAIVGRDTAASTQIASQERAAKLDGAIIIP